MLRWIDIWKRIGKQSLKITQHQYPKVFIGEDIYVINKIRYESGVPQGFECTKICCDTCRNNVKFPPPHTCYECMALGTDEYSIWEDK